MENYSTHLTIELKDSGGDKLDDLNATTFRTETDMTDCSVHAWFKLFERVLGAQGFSEEVIMRGATQLAFNDSRKLDVMSKLAKEYDLHELPTD
jgi:hypothetical protein